MGSHYPYSTYHYGKREAEAEPKSEADPYLLYGGHHYAPAVYSSGVYNYGHPYATSYYGHHYGKREAEARPYFYGYSHYPATTYHYGKREAEADPQVFYSGLYSGLHGYGYSGLHYPYTTSYYGHHLGKREAEAEPYYYGGYARPYGYGGYRTYGGYGYGRFGYYG